MEPTFFVPMTKEMYGKSLPLNSRNYLNFVTEEMINPYRYVCEQRCVFSSFSPERRKKPRCIQEPTWAQPSAMQGGSLSWAHGGQEALNSILPQKG